MKQTNNAIKFLMAQYRAIFNNAYFKGLATAALVTVAMAAGQAQAASFADHINGTSADNVKGDFTLSEKAQLSGSAGGYLTNLTIASGGTLEFDGSSTANTGHIHVYETLTVQNSGTLTLKGPSSSSGGGWGVVGATNPSSEDLTDFKPTSKLSVDGGTVNVEKSQIQMASVVLNDAIVEVKTNQGDSKNPIADNAQITAVAVYDDAGNHVAGTGLFTVKGEKSTITLDSGSILNAGEYSFEDGKITMKGGDADSGSGSVIRAYTNGGKLSGVINFQGTDVEVSGSTTGNYIGGKVINLKSGSDITISGSGSLHLSGVLNTSKDITAIASGAAAGTINLDGATLSIAESGSLVVDHADSVFNANSGKITNSGTLTFNNTTVNTTSALLKEMLAGKVDFANSGDSTLTITDDSVDLTSSGTGLLKDSGSRSDNLTLSGNLTLVAPEVVLGTKYAADKLTVDTKTLTLGSGDFTHSSGSINVSESLVGGGKYTISGGTLNLNATANGTVTKITGIELASGATSALNVYGAWDFGKATLTADSGGTVTFTKADISNIGEIALKQNGKVNLKDQSSLAGTNLVVASGGSLSLDNSFAQFSGTVTTNVSGAKVELANNAKIQFKYAEATKSGSANEGLGKLTIDGTSTLVLVDSGKTEIKLSELKTEKEKFISGAGLFELAGVKVTETGVAEDGTITYDKAQSGAGIADIYENATVTGVSGSVANSNDWGAAQLASGATSLELASGAALTLNGVNGNLVTQADGMTEAGVKLASGSTLSVQSNGGTLDAITTGTANEGKVLVGADLVVKNNIGASNAAVKELSVQKAGNTQVQNVYANVLNVDGKLEVAKDVTLSGDSTVNGFLSAQDITSTSGTLDVHGQVEATKITVSGDVSIGGSVVADELKLTSAAKVQVGDADSSGLLEIGTLNLSGGSLLIDPSFDLDASVVAIKDTTQTTSGADIVAVNGDIGVGMNSVLGIGLDAASAKDLVTRLGYLQNDKLQKDGVGAVLVVDNTLSIASGDNVIIDPTKDHAGLSAAISGASGNTLTLANGAGLVITDNMTTQSATGTAVIQFAQNGTFTAESGSVIAFDKALTAADNVQLTNANTVTTTGATISAANGLLVGTSDTSGKISFTLDTKAADKLYNQSTPIQDFTLSAIKGDFNANRTEAGVDYVLLTSGLNGGQAIEATSRLAVYGGSVQATNLAQQAATDAVVDRMSRANPNGSLVFANNAQGGGLWLSPVYKSHESDSFDADGVDYGVDGDLTGLVLGADSTTESGVRVGGYFNFGSADFDGKGIGEQVSSEADYFGFGLYAGMTFGQMSLVADAGFTQVSNDVEQNTGYAKYSTVTADVDSTAVTLGLRGEYKLNVATMDVTPHLGVRYTRLAVDSYDAKSAGKVLATTDVDTMQMFSVPFGVTISKDIAAGSWTIKPVFDLTLTANAGDTDAKLDTTFIGATPVGLTSEAFDSFTYGATMGIDAKYGENFSIGLNTNYVGSSNADEFGVMGNVRYMF